MNQALRLPEILDLVCAHVDSRADLAHLARTSRTWFSSSIAHLWRSGIKFQHIIALIPGTTSDQNIAPITETFPDELTPSMFNRLNLYAPRIAGVIVYLPGSKQGPAPREQARAINTILRYISGRVLFPRLQLLTIFVHHDSMPFFRGSTWLFLLLSPSITYFALPNAPAFHTGETPMRYRVLEVFLGLVLGTCSNLGDLCLSLLPRALSDLENNSQADYSSLPPLPLLRSLELDQELCSAASFDWISHLPRLQSLHISSDSTIAPLPQNIAAHAPPDAFLTLSKFDIYDFGFESFSNLWRSAVVRNLTEICIENLQSLNNREIAMMLPLIAMHTPNLRSFDLRSECSPEPDVELPLRALKYLPLVHFAISGFHGRQLDLGGGFEVVGRYWPMLEFLELDEFTIGYQDLLKVSLILPKLRELKLCLPLDPPTIDDDIPSRLLTTSWPNHGLEFTAYSGPSSPKSTRSQLENLGLLLAMVWPNMAFSMYSLEDANYYESTLDPVLQSIALNSAHILRQAQE